MRWLWIVMAVFMAARAAAQEACYLHTPDEYQRMGGAAILGPYQSREQCEQIRSQYFGNSGSCECQSAVPAHQSQPSEQFKVNSEDERRKQEAEDNARAQRQADEDHQRFLEKKKETLQSLKGVESESFTVKRGTDFLGLKGNPTVDVKLKTTPTSGSSADLSSAWKQLFASAYLSGRAVDAILAGDLEEGVYFDEQAAQAMAGNSIAVELPAFPPPPTPYKQSRLRRQWPPLMELYSALARSTTREIQHLVSQQNRLEKLNMRKAESQARLSQKNGEVKKRGIEVLELKKRSDTKPVSDAMAKALAALKAAKEALTEARSEDAEIANEQTAARKKMESSNAILARNNEMLSKARTNPEIAAKLLEQLERSKKQSH